MYFIIFYDFIFVFFLPQTGYTINYRSVTDIAPNEIPIGIPIPEAILPIPLTPDATPSPFENAPSHKNLLKI